MSVDPYVWQLRRGPDGRTFLVAEEASGAWSQELGDVKRSYVGGVAMHVPYERVQCFFLHS